MKEVLPTKILIILTVLFTSFLFFFTPKSAYALRCCNSNNDCQGAVDGSSCSGPQSNSCPGFSATCAKGLGDIESQIPNFKFAGANLGDIVSRILLYIFPIAGLALLVYLLIGGYTLMTSSGDPKGIEQGKKIITNALIGFLIVFASFWIVQIFGKTLGLNVVIKIFGQI